MKGKNDAYWDRKSLLEFIIIYHLHNNTIINSGRNCTLNRSKYI